VDVFTPLLPVFVPDTDANHAGFYGGVWSVGWSMTLWKILKFNKTDLHKFNYVLSDVVNL